MIDILVNMLAGVLGIIIIIIAIAILWLPVWLCESKDNYKFLFLYVTLLIPFCYILGKSLIMVFNNG